MQFKIYRSSVFVIVMWDACRVHGGQGILFMFYMTAALSYCAVGGMLALASQREGTTRLAVSSFMQISCTEIARQTATILFRKEL